MEALRVREAAGRSAIARGFRQLARTLFAAQPGWPAPPLAFELARLSPRQEPLWQRAERALLFAELGSQVVGRLLVFAVPSPAGPAGRFAWFDAVADQRVGRALWEVGRQWLRRRGCTEVLGPIAFTIHDEVGLLVEGFEHPPSYLMPYNAPQAVEQLLQAGFDEVRRFYSYSWSLTRDAIPLRADGKERDVPAGLALRPFSLARREDDTAALLEIYNQAFANNWGFEPLSPAACRSLVDQFIRFGDPRLVRVAELNGRPQGFILCVPDPNWQLWQTRGQPELWRVARLLWAVKRKRLQHSRVITLAVRPERRHSGIAHALIEDLALAGRNLGYQQAELSYIDANNAAMNTILSALGFPRCKTYAIYRRGLA